MKQNKTYVLGVTGPIGTGKSLVLDVLKDKYNCNIIKADDLGNEVKLKGNECFEPIVNLLGKDVLDENGEIDKSKMAAKMFSDESLIEKCNAIIHPAVKERINKFIANSDSKITVIEAALICEAGYFDILNELWFVNSDEDIRIKRLMESRGYSLDKCKSIISCQHDLNYAVSADFEYEKSSDREDYYGLTVIKNNSGIYELFDNIRGAMEVINGRIG